MGWLDIVLLMLACYRLTRLFVYDKITAWIRRPFIEEVTIMENDAPQQYYKLKAEKGIRHFFGELLSCYWCTGVWSAVFLSVGYLYASIVFDPLVLVLAVAGGASIIETVTQQFIEE